jgi:hypothetical protein
MNWRKFLIGGATVLRFALAMMGTSKDAGRRTIDWHVGADRAIPQGRGRDFGRTRRDEQRASKIGLIITTSLLCAVFAAATMFGGQAIGPLLRHAAAVRDANGMGALVFTMPDGVFCRHMSFDNTTGEIGPAAIERCSQVAGEGPGKITKFQWGKQ